MRDRAGEEAIDPTRFSQIQTRVTGGDGPHFFKNRVTRGQNMTLLCYVLSISLSRHSNPLPGTKTKEPIDLAPAITRSWSLRGEGYSIEDVNGNIFLNMTVGIAVTATGHPAVVPAIR